MDKKQLFAALKEETAPRLPEAREAVAQLARGGDTGHLATLRELLHRLAGTAGVAGLPTLARLAKLGEDLAVLGLEGEATPGKRLAALFASLLDAVEADLEEEPSTAPTPRPEVVSPLEPIDTGKGRVLLASDEGVSARLLSRFLEGAGFELQRTSLSEALAALPAAEVLLIDLPANDAPAFAHVEPLVRAAEAAKAVVLLTGKNDPASAPLKSLTATHAFLPKPVVPETLEAQVRTAVERHRAASSARSRAPTAQVQRPASATTALKVLIVDDSRVIRGLLRELLAEVGVRTVEAEDGSEALKVAEAERPDAVISDVQMPGLDGAELTRILRERTRGRKLPIVVLSALDDEASRQTGLAAGADAYLVKSAIDGPGLLAALKAAGLAIK